MPAYFIVQSTIKDEAQYQKYVQAVVPFIASFGGKLVARRAKVEVLEGEHDGRPVVMFEFPNMEAIRAFWDSSTRSHRRPGRIQSGSTAPTRPHPFWPHVAQSVCLPASSAGLMAYDLATTPSTGLRVQACGDCHLLNFGLFATPERNLVFDINDFDETLPAPWEWDVKRLAVSFAVAARDSGHTDNDARAAAIECVRAYREHLRDDSKKSPLDVWYERLDMQTLIEQAPDAQAKKRRQEIAAKAQKRIGEYLFPKISTSEGGRPHLVDQPPLLFHRSEKAAEGVFREALEGYRRSMLPSVKSSVRSLPPAGLCGEGRRHWQCGDPLLCRIVFLCGSPSPLAAIQGGRPLGARTVCGQERLCK